MYCTSSRLCWEQTNCCLYTNVFWIGKHLKLRVMVLLLLIVSSTIVHAIETQDNNDVLAYLLSNASTLLLLIHNILKARGFAGMAPQHCRSSSISLFGRMTQDSGQQSFPNQW
ncbi:hypothetical protein KIW84_063905 [Lathyrus oleraceus]|uniref:Uncharacterized protein n=1 Tax=Pisum sativum TaxID=3888 RepID=A0A9D4W8U6_PEA|nr:hypothetical protein KIW84_063905 [Pisum sativum]